eukprot:m.245225 g.245225  ORF g.245225 m.245225 type:complete len:139 (-) comp19478_c0_seq17:2715-3131(-)
MEIPFQAADTGPEDDSMEHMLFGSVGAVRGVAHPSRVAAAVATMAAAEEDSAGRILPLLLVGEGARDVAVKAGCSIVRNRELVTDASQARFERHKQLVDNATLIPQSNPTSSHTPRPGSKRQAPGGLVGGALQKEYAT